MAAARRFRLVDRLVVHEGPIQFSALAERMISARTRYLVLDLDRTLHLGRNMGELLGWELTALRAFGLDELARMEPERHTGRLLFDPSRLGGSLRYLWHGSAAWTKPGLHYFACGKLPAKNDWLRAWTYRRFGPEPVRTVQRIPQDTLFGLMAGVPAATLRLLAERVWDRHEPDQVITREDLAALREDGLILICPSLDYHQTYASKETFQTGYLLDTEIRAWFVRHYLHDDTDRENPLVSVTLSSNLHLLPKTLLLNAYFDPLRDETNYFANLLTSNRVKNTIHTLNSIHCFHSYGINPYMEEAYTKIKEFIYHLP